jgi:hypothetical protein
VKIQQGVYLGSLLLALDDDQCAETSEYEVGIISFSNQGGLGLLSGAGDGQHEASDVALEIVAVEVKDRIGVGCSGQQIFRLLT